MFRLSQIQDKPRALIKTSDITFVKKLVQSTNVFEAKGYMSEKHNKILGGWKLWFYVWRGLGEAGRGLF